MKVELRPFAPSDTEAVLALRERSFEGLDLERERARWRWEYETNPFTDPDVPWTWVAEAEGALIGNYGMLPLPMALDGERALGLCGMDFCVEPDQRHLGLGLRLTQRFLATEGCAVRFVTSPTPAAAKLMGYCGGQVLEGDAEPCLWVHPGGGAVPSGPEVEVVEAFDERADALFERVAAEHRLLTWRDHRYLNWRYRDYPFGEPAHLVLLVSEGARGLGGLAVLQYDPILSRAHLVELLTPHAEGRARHALVAEAVRRKEAAGWGDLYALHRSADVHGTLERAGLHRVQGHGLRFLLHGGDSAPGLDHWYLSSGDGDILFGVGH